MLTAAHVVRDATAIGVWLGVARTMDSAAAHPVDPAAVIAFRDADLALLPLSSPTGPGDGPLLFGAIDRDAPGQVHVVAAGCPRFKLRAVPGRREIQLREVHYAVGQIQPGSNAKTGTLEFTMLTEVPSDPDPDVHSPWEGMSGAAVFAGSRIVGVVGRHELRESTATLTVRPIAAALRGEVDAGRWWTALRRPPEAQRLDPVTEPTRSQLVVARAERAARAVAPAVLVSRADEIQRLHEFTTGTERFRWLEGRPFSGKTALLAWFVLHQPEGIDLAAGFLRRTTGDADARYVIDVIGQQLAAHADRPYVPASHLSAQRDDLLDLLEQAAAAAAQRGRRLLVVVDGLDEDQTPEPGLAVAAWLPDEDVLPANAQLLVASRAGVDISLPAGHVLRRHRVVLAPSDAAAGLERAANVELSAARAGGGLVYPLLGTLAAGVGDWAPEELTAVLRAQGLADVLQVQVMDTLSTRLSRTVTVDGAQVAFAHDVLLEETRRLYAADLPRFQDSVLDWCHAALLRAASGGTLPRFLDRHYVDQLAGRDGWTSLWLDLLAPYWRTYRNASPSTYLPLRDDLRRLDATARRAGAAALVARTAAAAALAETSGEMETTSRELAAALLRSGRWSTMRALNYLARLENRDERAMAIGVVAPALAPEPGVAELAEALYLGLGGRSDDERGWAALGVASLLAGVGDAGRVRQFVLAQRALGACEAGNAAVGALGGLEGDDLRWMLDALVENAAGLGRGFDLWRLARRVGDLDAGTRSRVEAALGRSLGRLVLGLLGVDDDDILNLGEALAIAAPCLTDGERRDEVGRAIKSAADRWGESDLLANVAPSAPPELHDMIDKRSARLVRSGDSTAADRGLVAAGLYAKADEARRERLRAELRTGDLRFSAADDGDEFLRRLAAGGLGAEALEYIRAWASDDASDYSVAREVASVAPSLPAELLPDALGLCETLEPSWRSVGRAAVYTRAVELGRDDLIDLSADRWRDADQMRRLAFEPGTMPRFADPWLRTAAAAQLALRGDLPAPRCARLLVASPAVLDLPEVTAILRALPLADDDAVAVYEAIRSGHGWLRTGRCLRDLLRVIGARHGTEALWSYAERGDPDLQIYVTTASGAELAAEDPARLHRLLEHHPEPALADAALGPHSGDPEQHLDRLCGQLSPDDLGEGRTGALRVLEALPPTLRTDVLERLLDDDYLIGRRGYVQDYEWAATRLSRLAHSLSLRQVGLVEEAVPNSGMGSGPRASLRAALARRRASLGDLDGFERTLATISDTHLRARTLLVAFGRYPIAVLPRWLDLALDFTPEVAATQRALLWPLAAERLAELPSSTAAELAGRWLDRSMYRQPGELFVDLPGLVPLLRAAVGLDAVQELAHLLTPAGQSAGVDR